MKVIQTQIPDVIVIEPVAYADDRGFFFESFNRKVMEITRNTDAFVQDNHSQSKGNVLRGLHYQVQQPQGKLIRVVRGEIFDVAVDLRKSSPTFGKWASATLSAENRRMMWIPVGFAHGFLTTSEGAECIYKATDYYAPQHERTIVWNDKDLAIDWPLTAEPVVSAKDRAGANFREAELFA